MIKIKHKYLLILISITLVFGLVLVHQTSGTNNVDPAKGVDSTVPNGVDEEFGLAKGVDSTIPNSIPIEIAEYVTVI